MKLCDLCQRTNTHKFDKIWPELHPVKGQSRWHHLGIDLIGPLPVTERDKKYILTVYQVGCCISSYFKGCNWSGHFSVPGKICFLDGPEKGRKGGVIHVIFINGLCHPQLFMTSGLPRVVTSDQRREFNNCIDRELMSLLGVTHRLTTAYHPQVGFYSICIL